MKALLASENQSAARLAATANPDLYRRNGFRVARVPLDISERELLQRLEEMRIQERLGRMPSAADGPLALFPPPGPAEVREALQRLRDPEQRWLDEMFWFWPASRDGDDAALQVLEAGDRRGAAALWERAASDPASRPLALHNLAILAHAAVLDQEKEGAAGGLAAAGWLHDAAWQSTYRRFRDLLGNDEHWKLAAERARRLNDPRLGGVVADQLRTALPAALLAIQAQLAAAAAQVGDHTAAGRHVLSLRQSGFAAALIERALQLAVKPTYEQLRLLCEAAAREAEREPSRAGAAARHLLADTHPLLQVIDDLLDRQDPLRSGSHDTVAAQALVCQVAYSRVTDDWKLSQELLALALEVAEGPVVCARLRENAAIVAANLAASLGYYRSGDVAETSADRR